MLDLPSSVEARRHLTAERAASLRATPRRSAPGALRRHAGALLVRLGVALEGTSTRPGSRTALPPAPEEAPACAGASSLS